MTNKALFIPYKITNGKVNYFICQKHSDTINLIPTGTCEKDEEQSTCALRELKEELGVKHFRNFFPLKMSQRFKSKFGLFFEKAYAFEIVEPIKIQKKELASYRFLNINEAVKALKYPFHKKAILKCSQILKNKSYNLIFTIVGPGGSGKDSIINGAAKKDSNLLKIKTYMTRNYKSKYDMKLREFVTPKQLKRLEGEGDIIEKNEMVGYWYASSYSKMISVLSKSKDGIINVDINGAQFYKNNFSNIVTIFINADENDLIDRLKNRQRDTDEYIRKRMLITKNEVAKSHICNYTIVNEQGKLEASIEKLLDIVRKERKA